MNKKKCCYQNSNSDILNLCLCLKVHVGYKLHGIFFFLINVFYFNYLKNIFKKKFFFTISKLPHNCQNDTSFSQEMTAFQNRIHENKKF